MLSEATPRTHATRQLWIVFGIWLVVSAAMIWFGRSNLNERMFPDPDDAMRLLQVRDWLAGQSWFDVTQYRLNPPAGGPMHWSRLVDLPIAAVILLVRPVLGQYDAETAALIVVPLLTLGVTMLLVHRIACRLMDGPAALLAVIATPGALGVMSQMRIMRIDHHGWQIVLALLALLGVLDSRPRRSGLMAGVAMALWLNISIEGLPFAAAVGAWFAVNWLADASAADRLKAYTGSLAGAGLLLFALTHAPSTWMSHPHDALNVAHLAAFGMAWLCCHFAARPDIANVWSRLGILAFAGGLALAAMFAVDPQCLQAPFASLDPLVKHLWYDVVDEGQPVWRVSRGDAGVALAQPLVGLVGAALAIRKSPAPQRSGWLAYAFLLCAATIAAILVIREATTASVLSLLGTAFLCDFALRRARSVSLMPTRVVATVGSLCIMTPAYAVPASVTPPDPRFQRALKSADDCVRRTELEKLRWLPTSNLASPLDITPAILANTPHRAIASGHHRNGGGIRDVILLFVGQPAQGREIIARRHIDYVVFCPNMPETLWWAAHGRNGLSAMLNANRPPNWLEPVSVPGLRALRVWRVRKDLITTARSSGQAG